ncbi:hypothetical protein G5I_11307 [Acromyrmex echinatior]|uniref:Peptidase C14 caspase domain-containing protein n=1 Tax=Acromyrmex echinatior TaxID=103372 RepID=F4WZ92_ACREC|nr:hypothetical protein G5I_11307 [Acromyrmex echinatior]
MSNGHCAVLTACRGTQLDNGVTVFNETDSIKSDTVKYSIPAYADILVAYSTYDDLYLPKFQQTRSIRVFFIKKSLHKSQ